MIPTSNAGICGIMPLHFAGVFPRRRPDSVGHGSFLLTRSLHHPLRPDGLKIIYLKSTDGQTAPLNSAVRSHRYLRTTLTTYAMRVPPRSQALRTWLRVSAENAQTINYKITIAQYIDGVKWLFLYIVCFPSAIIEITVNLRRLSMICWRA